jgi:SAM-dependent methyltransferase
MDKLDHPEINTTELAAEVRKAMARQVLKSHALPTNPSAPEDISPPASAGDPEKDNSTSAIPLSTDMNFASLESQLSSLPKSPLFELQPVFEPHPDDEYHLNDLLKFHDVDFLNAAYRAILKREPDSFGYNYYLEHLREGHIDKVDLLAILRFSTEGKLKNVRIKGLTLPTLIRRLGRLPVIGYPIRLGVGLLRLPLLIHRLQQREAYSLAQNRKVAEHANEVAEHVDSVNDSLAGYLSNLSAAVTDVLNTTELHADRHGQMKQQLETLVEQQQKLVIELRQEFRTQIDENRASAQEQTQRLIQEQQSLLESSTNDIRARIAQLEASARAWTAELESSVRAKIAALGSSTNEIRTKITEAESTTGDLSARISTVESSADDLRSTTDKLESLTNTTQAEIEKVYRQLQHARTELALQGRRMTLILEEARSRLPGPFDRQQLEIIATEEQHKLDALYAELEDNFRGSHEEIKERFRTYLPHIKSLVIADDMAIVDLGCGRGEWLELLQEEGYRGLGIDTNSVLLDRCRARGLEVIESDALRYLRGLPDDSLGAITGFHIIEHLQIEVLIQLLDESVRVLHPGGVLIFETPNPENVLVGSNYFYFDPTHRNPLPSLLMKLLLESRGLHRIEVMNLHAWDQARIGGKNELTARFNELFYGPMDYAIAGWKVSE